MAATPLLVAFAPVTSDDSFLTRVELLAVIQTLNAELLSHPSATATLENWCRDHGLAAEATVSAHLQHGEVKPLSGTDRDKLGLSATDTLRYRRVKLVCGDKLLSEADNWYVANRLTPEMNRLLDETDTPFGKAVAPLHFRRDIVAARLLWSPLPAKWETPETPPDFTTKHIEVPDYILEHRALLRTDANVAFSYVVETYTRDILAFRLPR